MRDLGECCELPAESGTELQPKSNLVRFSRKIRHQMIANFGDILEKLHSIGVMSSIQLWHI